jgi:hypothetical protein
LKNKSLSNKFKKSAMIYIFAGVICSFYTGGFILSRTIFNDFALSFQYIDTFFKRVPAISHAFFVIQKEYMYNREIITNDGIDAVLDALDQGYEVEKEFKAII